jgi:Lar family restriction alleviation protein
MSDAREIKPCPFCGDQPDVRERAGMDKGTYVCVISCMCGGYSALAHQYGVGLNPEYARVNALIAWNRRAPLAEAQP